MEPWTTTSRETILQTPQWEAMTRATNMEISRMLKESKIEYFSDLTDDEKIVFMDEVEKNLQGSDVHNAFLAELSRTINKNLAETVSKELKAEGNTATKVDLILNHAAQGCVDLLAQLPDEEKGSIRLMLNRELPQQLRFSAWRMFLTHPTARAQYEDKLKNQRIETISSKDHQITQRCQSLLEKHFPDLLHRREILMVMKTVLSYHDTLSPHADGEGSSWLYFLLVPILQVFMLGSASGDRESTPLQPWESHESGSDDGRVSSRGARSRGARDRDKDKGAQLAATLEAYLATLALLPCPDLSDASAVQALAKEVCQRLGTVDPELLDKLGRVYGAKGSVHASMAAAMDRAAAERPTSALTLGKMLGLKGGAAAGGAAEAGVEEAEESGGSGGGDDDGIPMCVLDGVATLLRPCLSQLFVGMLSTQACLFVWDQALLVGFARVVPMYAAITLALLKEQLQACDSPMGLEAALESQAKGVEAKQLQDAAELLFMPTMRMELGIASTSAGVAPAESTHGEGWAGSADMQAHMGEILESLQLEADAQKADEGNEGDEGEGAGEGASASASAAETTAAATAALRRVFDECDTYQTGLLGVGGLKCALRRFGFEPEMRPLSMLVAEVAQRGAGQQALEFEEFKALVLSHLNRRRYPEMLDRDPTNAKRIDLSDLGGSGGRTSYERLQAQKRLDHEKELQRAREQELEQQQQQKKQQQEQQGQGQGQEEDQEEPKRTEAKTEGEAAGGGKKEDDDGEEEGGAEGKAEMQKGSGSAEGEAEGKGAESESKQGGGKGEGAREQPEEGAGSAGAEDKEVEEKKKEERGEAEALPMLMTRIPLGDAAATVVAVRAPALLEGEDPIERARTELREAMAAMVAAGEAGAAMVVADEAVARLAAELEQFSEREREREREGGEGKGGVGEEEEEEEEEQKEVEKKEEEENVVVTILKSAMGALKHLAQGTEDDARQMTELVKHETDGMAEDREKAAKKTKLPKIYTAEEAAVLQSKEKKKYDKFQKELSKLSQTRQKKASKEIAKRVRQMKKNEAKDKKK